MMKIVINKYIITIKNPFVLEINWMWEVKNALKSDLRLKALKIYHEHNKGKSLRESKEAVDKLIPKYWSEYKKIKNNQSRPILFNDINSKT